MSATKTEKQPGKPATRKRSSYYRVWGWKWRILIGVVVLLIAARLYLPVWLLHYVNRKINEMPGYSGYVQDIDVSLWRGAYVIRKIDIFKSEGKVPVPFFSSETIDLSVQWKALFDGALVGNMELDQPKINFVKGPTKAQTQVGVDKPWVDQIKQLFPLKINRFHVDNGEIHYRDFFSNPKLDMVISDVYMTTTNITNSQKLSKSEIATIHAEGKPMHTGSIKADVSFDPYQSDPTFKLKLELADLPLTALNDLTRAYAFFDFEGGKFDMATEMNASGGSFSGYVEPVFDHMKIVSLQKDIKNPVKLVWEGLLEGVGIILRNQPKDRFATKVPLSGSFKDPHEAVLSTIGNVFKNAFVHVFSGKVPGSIDVHDVYEKQAPKD